MARSGDFAPPGGSGATERTESLTDGLQGLTPRNISILVDLRVRVLSHDDVVKISLSVVAFPPPTYRSSNEARTAESQLMHWRSRTTA
jgi:hypothetical protein